MIWGVPLVPWVPSLCGAQHFPPWNPW
jgi:hypothetical protein